MVSKSDVSCLNERYAPWAIEKAKVSIPAGSMAWPIETQARNIETGEVIYRCEGWSKASRGQALNAIIKRRASSPAAVVADSLAHLSTDALREAVGGEREAGRAFGPIAEAARTELAKRGEQA